jgi:DNA-binding LytR/AlgR family response regulator
MEIKILVVEDEKIVAKDIQNCLIKIGYDVIGIASNGETALSLIESESPDLILMDIMLKGSMSGVDIAKVVKDKYNIPVIFLTAYADEHTLAKAKVTEPYGYIIKPFKEIDLHTSIEMALYKHGKEKEYKKERDLLYSLVENTDSKGYVFVRSDSKLVKLKMSDIYYIEALKDYVVINTKETRYTVHSTMKHFESRLQNSLFTRVHRSFIVRLDKIASIDMPNIVMEDINKVITIGGSYKDDLLKKLELL